MVTCTELPNVGGGGETEGGAGEGEGGAGGRGEGPQALGLVGVAGDAVIPGGGELAALPGRQLHRRHTRRSWVPLSGRQGGRR